MPKKQSRFLFVQRNSSAEMKACRVVSEQSNLGWVIKEAPWSSWIVRIGDNSNEVQVDAENKQDVAERSKYTCVRFDCTSRRTLDTYRLAS